MLKYLLIIGVIAAVYFFFVKKSMPLTKARKEQNKESEEDDTMVPCESCGTYISTRETVVSSGRFYCSTQCRDKA